MIAANGMRRVDGSQDTLSSAAAGKVTNIPVVVQLGRWRKQFTIATTACTNNLVPAFGTAAADKTAALPTKKSEGDIPLTAISTGNVDGLECVFRKMGVDDTEFTDGAGSGRIRLYQDNGAMIGAGSPKADSLYCPLGKSGAAPFLELTTRGL